MMTLSRLLAGLLFAVLSQTVMAQSLPVRFDPQRDAATDLITTQNLARTSGKRILVDVGGEWCSWCRMFDRFVAEQPQVRAAIDKHFVWLKVNFSRENKNEETLAKWPKIRGYPYFLILDGSGKVLHAQGVQGLEVVTENDADENYDLDRVMSFLNRHASSESHATGQRLAMRPATK